MSTAYNEYPLMMCHPDHVDAVPDEKVPHRDSETGPVTIVTVKGAPEVLPHVTVHNAAEEAKAHAKGYRRPGTADAEAVAASIANPHVPGRVAQEYPKYVPTGEHDADGKPIMKVIQDPNAVVEDRSFPKWLTVGKAENGDPIGVTVNSLGEEAAARLKYGLVPEPTLAPKLDMTRKAVSDMVDFRPISAEEEAARIVPAMTRGQKIAATKARKKAERLAAQSSQTAA
jgi:hypothetical protein